MVFQIVKFAVISLLVVLIGAVILILSQRPKVLTDGQGLDFTQTLARTNEAPAPQIAVTMRDGFALQVREYPSSSPDVPLVVFVHGSGWHGVQFDALARKISDRADVLVPDLRGHGAKPGVRGDISYIGQLEDDLADLIAARRKDGQALILAGHSSGGGLVVRFAGGPHGAQMDGAVLMAPFLKYDAPMTRPNSGGWAQVMVRRVIGLSILNTFRIRALNHLTVIQFAMPRAVLDGPLGPTATTAYSYRLNTSFAPRARYLKDVAALPRFVLIVGAMDEAFDAALYAPTMREATDKGSYVIVPSIGHLDIVDAGQTQATLERFLDDF